jgi:hypothetical protein
MSLKNLYGSQRKWDITVSINRIHLKRDVF